MLPEPGSKEYEDMIDFIRADLNNRMLFSKLINEVRKSFEWQGRDFNQEFKTWKENKR